jgi:hypothetical protein
MCTLHRRDFLFGLSGLLLSACASEEYSDGKDYYPVAYNSSGTIYHWGKNNSIKVDTNTGSTASPSSYETHFKAGMALWDDTLSSLGITVEYTSSSPDVKVKWLAGSEVSRGVLGYATPDNGTYQKYIIMTNTNNVTEANHSDDDIKFIAAHEFGHMLGIWNHSFDSNDIMYPYATGSTALSNRDKRTLADSLYQMTPTTDMHDLSGPSPIETGISAIPVTTYYTTNGCVIQS